MHENDKAPVSNKPLEPVDVLNPLGAVVAEPVTELLARVHRVQVPKPHRKPVASEAGTSADELADGPFADENAADDEPVAETSASADLVRVYLKQIGKVALLNAEEEVDLAKRIEAGLFAGKLYGKMIQKTLSTEENQYVRDQGRKAAAYLREQGIQGVKPQQQLLKDLRWIARDGERAKTHLMEANLRLVVSLAKRYTGHGMPFLDIIQEGNLGLNRAVEKFDYAKGYKFSTYATWWIRQAITRAMADQARTIRLPAHMMETINKMGRIERGLMDDLGREPTAEEVAEALDTTPEKVRELQGYRRPPVSLDQPAGEDGGRGQAEATLGDFVTSDETYRADATVEENDMHEKLYTVLKTLDPREQQIVSMRYGIGRNRPMTLDEIGDEFGLSRERIRQIEREAMGKLRHPSRTEVLRDYLD